jgi:hypothetical protein
LSIIKKTGSLLGEFAGTITGEPIKFIGKRLNNDYIQEIGSEVRKATTNTGATIGSLAEGTWNIASGLIQKDDKQRDEGANELKNTFNRTAKGMGQSVKNTYVNGKDVVRGVTTNNKYQIIRGAKGIGKTVAVATLAVGALDILDVVDVVDLDGPEDIDQAYTETIDGDSEAVESGDFEDSIVIETRNESLVGEHHPISGVMFEEKVVTLPSGEHIQGVFPDFDSESSVTIPESMYLESDNTHFSYANQSLAEQINQNPGLASHFSHTQLQQIFSNQTPEGFTWHHSEEAGKLELVDEEIHAETGHTGGRELWGGGLEKR